MNRVREIENGSFTPLVFSTSGGMGKAAKITYKRLASLLSIKREQPYSLVMGWLRCRLSFSLLRSAVMCLRGSRSKKGHVPLSDTHIELVVHEGRLPLSSWILRVFLPTFCNIFFTPYNYEFFFIFPMGWAMIVYHIVHLYLFFPLFNELVEPENEVVMLIILHISLTGCGTFWPKYQECYYCCHHPTHHKNQESLPGV